MWKSTPSGPRESMLVGIGAAVALLVTRSAFAHELQGAAGGFISGLSHPVSGADHVLAMIAVGLWGAQLGSPALWLLPVMFPTVMACGGFIGLIGMPLPGVEFGIALSAIVLGIMVAAGVRPPLGVSIAVVSIFAVFHGHAHGTELPENQSGLVYSIGFVICTGLLHATGILIGAVNHWDLGKAGVRALGVIVLAGGCCFLWSAVA